MLGPDHYGQVKIIKKSSIKVELEEPDQNDLDLTKTVWTRPKHFATVQNNFNGPKSFWTNRRTRHN